MYYTPWQLEVAAHRIGKGLPVNDPELAMAAGKWEQAQTTSAEVDHLHERLNQIREVVNAP